MQSNKYTICFAFTVCLILSVLLSVTYISLKDKQELNRKLDRQKNILIAAGFSLKNNDDIELLFSSRVHPMVIDVSGDIIKDKLPEDILPEDNKIFFPIFKINKPHDENITDSFVYPIQGKGLWSTMYGYLAVDPDGDKIKGITFHKQGETPGLGGEIEKEWFRDNFIGKKLYNLGKIVGVKVLKGKASDHALYSINSDHMVDGISGATLTCNGITNMLKIDPLKYVLFFSDKNR